MARRGAIGDVLAGGAGRRIGGDKATVELEGRPLLLYPLAVLRAVLDDVAVVAKRATILPALDPDVEIWLEADEPRHPLAGVVRAALRARALSWRGRRHAVRRGLVKGRASAPAAPWRLVPQAAGGLQPLCARATPER